MGRSEWGVLLLSKEDARAAAALVDEHLRLAKDPRTWEEACRVGQGAWRWRAAGSGERRRAAAGGAEL